MLACEIAGRAVQNRDDLVRRKGDRVRETWLAVIELDEIERRIVEDDAAEHVAVGEKAKIILGEGSDPIAIVDVEICERSLETGHRRWRNIEAGSPGSCLLRLDVRCITKQRQDVRAYGRRCRIRNRARRVKRQRRARSAEPRVGKGVGRSSRSVCCTYHYNNKYKSSSQLKQ